MFSLRLIILVLLILIHHVFWFKYTLCVVAFLPMLFLDYVSVLSSKIGQHDFFSFFIAVTHYFIVKAIFILPFDAFCKTYKLYYLINAIKFFFGFSQLPLRSLLADFNVYTFFILKYIIFFRLYIQLLKIQFENFQKDKSQKESELLCEFKLDENEYKFLFLKRQLRVKLLLLQFFFSIIYFIIVILLLVLFNTQTINIEYFVRVITEFDTNPYYRLRYGHFYRR